MENPEIKSLLKSAKEAIKNKDAKEALKLCKSVIDKDKENYLGWVMTGAAAQELNNKDQALAAFQRAIQITPNQAPAWQGLAQLYEKTNSQSDLVSVYSELRRFFANDANKYFDYSNKYANCLLSQGKTEQAISVFYDLLKNKIKDKSYTTLTENLARLLALSNEQKSEVYFDVIEMIKSDSEINVENELAEKINENALKSMIKHHESWKKIFDQSFDLLKNYSKQNEFALRTLFEIYAETLIGKIEIDQTEKQNITSLLEDETNQSSFMENYRLFINAVNMLPCLDQSNISEFKRILEQIQDQLIVTNKLLFLYLENNYFAFICNFDNTIKTGQESLELMTVLKVKDVEKDMTIKINFNMACLNFFYHEFDLAIERFDLLKKKNLPQDLLNECNRYLVECYLKTQKKELAVELLRNEVDNTSFTYDLCELIIKYETNDFVHGLELAKRLCNSQPDNHDCNILMAKICYNLLLDRKEELEYEEIKTLCFQSNIKAIKLSPYKWESIYQLGIYYKYLVKDYKKALKCFQKSYELCLNLKLCGIELVDTLLYEKNDEIAFNLLKKALDEIENCKWASLRLGVIYLKKGESNEAIRLFYNVIRNNPDDYNMWECLADAYLNRGSLTAALKSFNKVIELNPDSSYAYYQIAHIKQTLNLYDQAILDYFAVLNKMTNHIPTFKGLGETYYLLAVENIKNSTNNKYLEYIELSIKYLTKAICLRKDLCCVWKILGDCCNMIRFYPNSDPDISIPTCILKKKFNIPDTEMSKVTSQELFKLAEESYLICCKLKPECGTYWYDLSLTYLFEYKTLSSNIQNMTDKANSTVLINRSKECLITAVNLEPTNSLFWNNLGILYAFSEINKPHLAQHFFLKSIKLDDSNAVTWTNLGVFYLLNDENMTAHECFKKSQALDPDYGVAWIGQAFIAETVEIEQCIDLYRHAVELGLHTEAYYGYARIVSKISNNPDLKNETIFKDYIQFLNAIPLSSDCLIKYCDRIINNPDAFFLSGVLLEKLNLPLTAIKYYEKVFELIDDDENEICLLSRRGYARLLSSQNQYESALIQYKRIDIKNSIEDIFSLAKVFYNLGKYQQCAKIFESALNICPETEKSIVYTAMGMAISKYNIQEAITCFFKSFQCKAKCIQSLFALCSIGLLKNDKALISAVFKELDSMISDLKYRFDIIKLKSVYYCLEKEFDKAIRWVSKYVHEYPSETKSWMELCLCLKRGKSYDLALLIGKTIFTMSSQANLIFYECVQYLLLQRLKQNELKDPSGYLLKMFQKTLHMFPANLPSWNSFAQFLKIYEEEDGKFKGVAEQIQVSLTSE